MRLKSVVLLQTATYIYNSCKTRRKVFSIFLKPQQIYSTAYISFATLQHPFPTPRLLKMYQLIELRSYEGEKNQNDILNTQNISKTMITNEEDLTRNNLMCMNPKAPCWYSRVVSMDI